MLLLMKFTASPEASVGVNPADHKRARQPAGIGHLEVISRATATMIFPVRLSPLTVPEGSCL
jgi:hypothetical protein